MSWMKDLKKGFEKVRSEVESGINDFTGKKDSQGQQQQQQPGQGQQQQYGQYYQQQPPQQYYQQPPQQYYQQPPPQQGQYHPPQQGQYQPPPPGPPPPGPPPPQQGQYHSPPPGPPPPGPPPPGPRPPPQREESGDGAPPPPPPPGSRPPPPESRPPQGPGAAAYWKLNFQQDIPVGVQWDAKLGNGPDGWGNQELQFYTAEPSNSFHTPNGLLVLRALANSQASNPEQKYTSARLVSRETLSRDRGSLTAVILSPCAQGIWPAFWLLPQEPFSWPVDGEIDIAETWNGDHENHSCLHWGYHEEPHKHRVLGTKIPDMHQRPVRYDLVWDQPGGQPGQGRLVWYIDGRPVMKCAIPEGTRPIRDMSILLNVAMGGNVCKGVTPNDGYYDMVIYSMYATDEPELGGWAGFDHAWHNTPDGHTY